MLDIQTDGTPIAAAAPPSTPRTPRRVRFMARLASKRVFRQGGSRSPGSRKRHFALTFLGLSLTFRACGGLTPAIIGKTFFSTRRPALEAGGQRPTARCALGRKRVWTIVLAALPRHQGGPKLGCRHPPPGLAVGEPDDWLQRVIQYSRAARLSREAAAYWIPRWSPSSSGA